MKLSPEMIDAAVLQLRSIFLTGENIPPYVKESGTKFLDDLDKWSDALREKEKENVHAAK